MASPCPDALDDEATDTETSRPQHKTGTVYLGRIPKGFYEDEMRSYFSQFGEVTRLRLSRNKKVRSRSRFAQTLSASASAHVLSLFLANQMQTGASKHYAFIEFKYASVAQIVHETMDNYLLAGHILVCKVVPEDEIHPKLWVGANRKFRPVPKARQDAARRTKPKTDKQQDAIRQRLLKQEDKKRKQLADLGIEYDFGGYAGKEVAGDEKDEDKKAKKDKAAPAEAGAEETPRRRSARKSAGGAAATPTQVRRTCLCTLVGLSLTLRSAVGDEEEGRAPQVQVGGTRADEEASRVLRRFCGL